MHRVVIIGGGFGGLYAAQALGHAPVQVTLKSTAAISISFSRCSIKLPPADFLQVRSRPLSATCSAGIRILKCCLPR